jgi:hypothetical protein
VLVEGDAFMGMTEKLRQDALALFDRRAPQVLAVKFETATICGNRFEKLLPLALRRFTGSHFW